MNSTMEDGRLEMGRTFRLCAEALDPAALAEELAHPRAGALVAFEGWVRNHNDGRPVEALEYEAFGPMAVSEGEKLLSAAQKRFAILDVLVAHRTGPVAIGDRAVWVGVTSEHRQEAFLACRWIMDALKREVPIWKRETYADRPESEWVNAGAGGSETVEDAAANPHYARQIKLPGFGAEGQRKLANARVLVIGAGGLGCPALQYLAAAGVGALCISDGDRVEASNLHRQILYGASDIGRNKAEAAADRLRDLNPHISLRALADAATPSTLPNWLREVDLVLDCCDGFESAYAIHDLCWNAGIPLVQAAVHQFDGWVQVIDPACAAEAGCFRCQWPEAPPVGCVGTCADAGVLGATPGLLGVHQAAQALQVLLDWPDALRRHTLHVDLLSGATRRLRRRPRADCVCAKGPQSLPEDHLLYPGSKARTLLSKATVIDIREAIEREDAPDWILGLPHAPRSDWEQIPERFPQRPLVLACAAGVRTRLCLELLGHPPGIHAWTRPITDLPGFDPER